MDRQQSRVGQLARRRGDSVSGLILVAVAAVLAIASVAAAGKDRDNTAGDNRSGVAVAVAYQATTTMRLEPTFVPAVSPGALVRIEVWLDDPQELAGFQFTMSYDSEYVDYDSVELGPLLGSTGREVVEFPAINRGGSVSYGAASLPGQPGPSLSGLLAVVTLRALADGSSEVSLDDVEVADSANRPIPTEVGPPIRVTVRGDIFLPFATTR